MQSSKELHKLAGQQARVFLLAMTFEHKRVPLAVQGGDKLCHWSAVLLAVRAE
jgi:hypothetical protein